jgi:type III pantothenate kinase
MPHSGTPQVDLVAFDVGNTSVKCASPVAGGWERIFRCPTLPLEGLAARMQDAGGKALPRAGSACAVASVCPGADEAVTAFCRGRGWEPRFFRTDIPIPLPTRLAEPEKVGVDRLLLALGALDAFGAPCIVAGAGTAVTVDLVDAEGAFAGGAIMPGLGLTARALHVDAALLPLVPPAVPDAAVGTDTEAAIRSGVYWSCAGGVRALVERYRAEPGCADALLILTGTDAPLLLPALAVLGARHAPDLIFDGMAAALAGR